MTEITDHDWVLRPVEITSQEATREFESKVQGWYELQDARRQLKAGLLPIERKIKQAVQRLKYLSGIFPDLRQGHGVKIKTHSRMGRVNYEKACKDLHARYSEIRKIMADLLLEDGDEDIDGLIDPLPSWDDFVHEHREDPTEYQRVYPDN